jgi:uncharacterized protein YndB with AHSA1/START domain
VERRIDRQIVVPAPREEVWKAWTTSEGAITFFAPRANIELRLGGAYELLWSDDAEASPGFQGSEGCTVLSYLPGEMLSFTWNAPPEFLTVRSTPTFAVVRLADAELDAQCPAIPGADEPMALQLVQRTPGVSTGSHDRRQEACVETSTLVRLSHLGWQEGAEWDRVYEYFESAWWTVLTRLRERFAHGPIDWADPYVPPERRMPAPRGARA